MPALEVRQVSVRFGGNLALDEASLSAESGQITGLIGPNGAGKTTMFNVITGLLTPTSGRILHRRTRTSPGSACTSGPARAGPHVPAARAVLDADRAGEHPGGRGHPAPLVQGQRRHRPTLTESIIERVGLADVADARVTSLPTGQGRLVELGRALACKPKVLLLDEPASGQDDHETERFGQLLVELAGEGTAVVLVEHDMSLVMEVCHQVHVLDLGRIIAKGEPHAGAARPGGARRLPGHQQAGGLVSAVPTAEIEVEPLLELRGLRAGYDGVEVLHGVDLAVRPGRVVALLGPNGAGKSTTLRSSPACSPRPAATCMMAGRRVNGARPEDLARLGLCLIPEGRGIFPNLTVRENLWMMTHRGRDIEAGGGGDGPPLPAARPVHAPHRGHAVGRRAADAGDGPRPGHRSGPPRARRALDGARTDRRGPALRDGQRGGQRGNVRSSSSSSSRGS